MSLGFAITVFLAIMLLVQAPAAITLLWRWWRPSREPGASQTKAAVILCVKGADETLERCLEGIFTQAYPNYEVVIVVDAESDPGWAIVQHVAKRFPGTKVRIEPLVQRMESCSLKCSALIQAVAGLDNSIEAIALIDADTVPTRSWLCRLIAPLAWNEVGAVAGVRWYSPSAATWGDTIRYLWNVPAIVCMRAFRIAWGGSLAFRRDALVKADLLQKWTLAYCEDTMTHAALKHVGLRLVYASELVMIHDGSCDLKGFCEWCVRQMLTSRLYHPAWYLIVAHGVVSTLAWVIPLGALVAAIAIGEWLAVTRISGAIGVYWVLLAIGLFALELSAQRTAARLGPCVAKRKLSALFKLAVAIPLAQAIYFRLLMQTLRIRRVQWRSVWYEIAGPWNVRREV